MAEAFAIFGAVAGALGTLNLARQLIQYLYNTVQQYRAAAATLLALEHRFVSFQVRLETWANLWDLSESTTNEFYIALWSTQRWESISTQLATIDNTSEDFARSLAKIVSHGDIQKIQAESQDTVSRRSRPGPRSSGEVDEGLAGGMGYNNTRADKKRQQRIMNDVAKKAMRPKAKAKLVVFEAAQLSKLIDTLDEQFNRLDADSKNFFAAAHPNYQATASVNERRETAAAKMVLQHALNTRDSSEALYQACLTLNHRDHERSLGRLARLLRRGGNSANQPNLEINLSLREKEGSPSVRQRQPTFLKLHYHILIPWPEREARLEVLVEAPVQSSDQRIDGLNQRSSEHISHSSSPIQNFKDACMLVQSQKYCDFQASLESTPNTFRLTSPSEPIQSLSHKQMHLARLLDLIQTKTSFESHEHFPLSERLDLAYNIVECGLLLLGTSWLSNLSSKKIQRISRTDREQRRRFILETGDFTNEDLASVEPQIFNVGVLLTEIAIGQPVLRIKKYETTSGSELHLVMASLLNFSLNSRSLPANQVVDRVNKSMGQRYSRAVEFCLQQSPIRKRPSWRGFGDSHEWNVRDQAYRVILEEYYEEVFLP